MAAGAGATGAAAGPIIGLLGGMFSFGGLFAGRLIVEEQKRMDRKPKDQIPEANRRSTLRWLILGAVGTLLLGVLALPIPAIAPLITPAMIAAAAGLLHVPAWLVVPVALALGAVTALRWPITGLLLVIAPALLAFPLNIGLAAVAFLAFGLINIMVTMKTDTFVDTNVPGELIADAQGAVKAGSMFAAMLGLIALKFLFQGKLPFFIPSPFPSFTGLEGPAAFLWVTGGSALLGGLIARAALRFAAKKG
jgi:hypothetical protein